VICDRLTSPQPRGVERCPRMSLARRANRPLGASYRIVPTAPTYETQAMLSLPSAALFVAVGALFFICLKKKRT
jgi:hypothetical protein